MKGTCGHLSKTGNNSAMLSDINGCFCFDMTEILNSDAVRRILSGMKRTASKLILVFALFVATAGVAQASCIAEYKAKRDNPLELFFAEAAISGACTVDNATRQLQSRLAAQGLTLLKIVSLRQG